MEQRFFIRAYTQSLQQQQQQKRKEKESKVDR